MFHGWMFDPDGDQAAADSTRSSTSLDTGSSVNPRTARRLVTAYIHVHYRDPVREVQDLLSRQLRIDALLLYQDTTRFAAARFRCERPIAHREEFEIGTRV